jgi:glycosyltransferase involved in cell wall biosynthesis
VSAVPSDPAVRIVVHDLSRTGVPVVLLRYVAALPAGTRAQVSVLAAHDGPLRADLEAMGVRVAVVWSAGLRSPGRLAAGAFGLLGAGGAARRGLGLDVRRAARRLPRPDVVVLHGAGALGVPDGAPPDVPFLVHLHELELALGRSAAPTLMRRTLDRAVGVAVVAPPVRDALNAYSGWRGPVVELPGVADRVTVEPPGPEADGAVVGVGAPDWRKGADRMQALAAELTRRGHGAEVRWVGGRPSGREAAWVDAPSPVSWVPSSDRPWEAAGAVRVVVVPSREDPLPLAVLEAGARGLPVVAMRTGGLVELLADGRGVLVDPGDVVGLVDGVDDLLADPERARALGRSLHAAVRRDHDPQAVSARWWRWIQSASGPGPEGPQGAIS